MTLENKDEDDLFINIVDDEVNTPEASFANDDECPETG